MNSRKRLLLISVAAILASCGIEDSSSKQDSSSSRDDSSSYSSNEIKEDNCYKKIDDLSSLKSAKKVIMVASSGTSFYGYSGTPKAEKEWYHEAVSLNSIDGDSSILDWNASVCFLNISFLSDTTISIGLEGKNTYLWAGYVTDSSGSVHANLALKNEPTAFNVEETNGSFHCYSEDKVYLEYYNSSFCGAKETYKESAIVSFYVPSYVEKKNNSSSDSSLPTPSPSDYWKGLDFTQSGNDFRESLQKIIKSYKTKTASYSDCLSIGAKAAAYPNRNSSTFVPFYHSAPDSGSSGATTTTVGSCNREHTWPNSRGCGKSGPGADPFIIRPTLTKENNSRGNSFYGLTSSSWDPASCGYEGARGEASRVILYAATAYYGTCGQGGTSKGSKPLELINSDSDDQDNHTMGKLSTLLAWNREYPVTKMEIQINDYLYQEGYGRNPFVDVPTYADYIWSDNGLRQ